MPTGNEFTQKIQGADASSFTVNTRATANVSVFRYDGWSIIFRPSSSSATLLNFLFEHSIDTTLYLHLLDGELNHVLGRRLQKLLTLAVEKAKPDTAAVLGIRTVDLPRDNPAVASIIDSDE
ncbi:hypothetical protein FRB90_002673 [Tulasnella sp. 427]|nr:hypothetical protein FRB90_002673 [Tulasnella sp. 427]